MYFLVFFGYFVAFSARAEHLAPFRSVAFCRFFKIFDRLSTFPQCAVRRGLFCRLTCIYAEPKRLMPPFCPKKAPRRGFFDDRARDRRRGPPAPNLQTFGPKPRAQPLGAPLRRADERRFRRNNKKLSTSYPHFCAVIHSLSGPPARGRTSAPRPYIYLIIYYACARNEYFMIFLYFHASPRAFCYLEIYLNKTFFI